MSPIPKRGALTLRTKLMIFMVTLSSLPLLIFFFTSMSQSNQAVDDFTDHSMKSTKEQIFHNHGNSTIQSNIRD